MVGWYRPERTNSVLVPSASAANQAVQTPAREKPRAGKPAIVPAMTTDSALPMLSSDSR
jgi:hypothetical protein